MCSICVLFLTGYEILGAIRQGKDLFALVASTEQYVSSVTTSLAAVVSEDDDRHKVISRGLLPRESHECTAAAVQHQLATACQTAYAGRHNLPPLFPLLRLHLPDARTLIDIGANKGLVSLRWLQLWRPNAWQAPTPAEYANDWIARYWARHNLTKSQTGSRCGVTSMCVKLNLTEQQWLETAAPILATHQAGHVEKDPFMVHSFEPSIPVYNMHPEFLNQTKFDALRQHWKWHRIAAFDDDSEMYFSQFWNEGSGINLQNTQRTPNTLVAKLDTLALQDHLFHRDGWDNSDVDNIVIDVLKIDAEGVDARVMVGAAELLQRHAIRVVMWETPNNFPLHFPATMGGPAFTFGELIDRLDGVGMTCYFPGQRGQTMIRLTSCAAQQVADTVCHASPHCPYRTCKLQHSNALCVHRQRASTLYAALEKASLVYGV